MNDGARRSATMTPLELYATLDSRARAGVRARALSRTNIPRHVPFVEAARAHAPLQRALHAALTDWWNQLPTRAVVERIDRAAPEAREIAIALCAEAAMANVGLDLVPPQAIACVRERLAYASRCATEEQRATALAAARAAARAIAVADIAAKRATNPVREVAFAATAETLTNALQSAVATVDGTPVSRTRERAWDASAAAFRVLFEDPCAISVSAIARWQHALQVARNVLRREVAE